MEGISNTDVYSLFQLSENQLTKKYLIKQNVICYLFKHYFQFEFLFLDIRLNPEQTAANPIKREPSLMTILLKLESNVQDNELKIISNIFKPFVNEIILNDYRVLMENIFRKYFPGNVNLLKISIRRILNLASFLCLII